MTPFPFTFTLQGGAYRQRRCISPPPLHPPCHPILRLTKIHDQTYLRCQVPLARFPSHGSHTSLPPPPKIVDLTLRQQQLLQSASHYHYCYRRLRLLVAAAAAAAAGIR